MQGLWTPDVYLYIATLNNNKITSLCSCSITVTGSVRLLMDCPIRVAPITGEPTV